MKIEAKATGTPKGRGRIFLLGLIVTLILGAGASFQAGAQAIKVHLSQAENTDFPTIKLYADIDDANGKPINGLGKSDFKVFEDQKLVAIQDFADPSRSGPLTTVLVLDCSGSMGKAGKMEGLKAAAVNYARYMKKTDRLGIVAFDNSVRKLQDLTSNQGLLNQNLKALQAGGRTAFFDAIYEAVQMMAKVKGRKVVLAITDGMDNSSSKSLEKVVELANKSGVPVYNVGLGERGISLTQEEGIDESAMRQIAGQTGGLYYYAPAAEELLGIYEHLSRRFHGGYELTYLSPNPVQDGTTRMVEIKATSQGSSAESRNSYYIPGVIVPVANNLIFLGLLIPLLFLAIAPSMMRRRRSGMGGVDLDSRPAPVPETTRERVQEPRPENRPAPPSAARRPVADLPIYLHLVPYGKDPSRQSFALRKGENFIGSDGSNDIIINHPSVSAVQARIQWKENRYIINDLRSQNGTFVSFSGDLNRERQIGESALQVGSVVRFGEILYRVAE